MENKLTEVNPRNREQKLSLQETIAALEVIPHYSLASLGNHAEWTGGKIMQAVRYLKKTKCDLSMLKDYWRMAARQGLDLDNPVIRWPRDLRTVHDRLQEVQRYPKAMLAKTVPLDLDVSDVMLQIKQWADEIEEERWKLLESLGISRARLENSLKELKEYESIGNVESFRLLHNRFGREVEGMKCLRPSWSDRDNDFCPCDNPQYGENPGESENPCEDCGHYKEE